MSRSLRSSRWVYLVLGLLLLFSLATLRLFLYPARNSPRHVDAIVVLGGGGPRLVLARRLVREGYAPNLLVSTPGQGCPAPIPHIRILCFDPNPSTTQGEARYTAARAKQFGWKHLIVISSTEQTTRARIRFKRCTDVDIAYVPASPALSQVPYQVAYEWAALAKALVWQRGC